MKILKLMSRAAIFASIATAAQAGAGAMVAMPDSSVAARVAGQDRAPIVHVQYGEERPRRLEWPARQRPARMEWPARMAWRSPRTAELAFAMGRRLVRRMVPALLGAKRVGQPQLDLRLPKLLWALPRAKRLRPERMRATSPGLPSSEIETPDQAAGMGDAAASSSFDSSSVKSRLRVKNRRPSGASREKPAPRPGTTSMMSCVCFQYSNCAAPI